MKTKQVHASHYVTHYDSRARLYSYVEQIEEIRRLAPQTVLEVGVGSGYLTAVLRLYGYQVETVDIDAELRPDVVASVDALPQAENSFDLAVCFQVLEHLPYAALPDALRQLAFVSRKYVLISLPDIRPCVRVMFARRSPVMARWWLINGRKLWHRATRRWQDYTQHEVGAAGEVWGTYNEHVFDGQHYWEIGKRETPLPAVLRAIAEAGLQAEVHWRGFLNAYHHFFLLRPDEASYGS